MGSTDRATSSLTLRLFGALEAIRNGTPLAGLHLREGERLLAYLTLHAGTPVSYRTLARLFWPMEAAMANEDSGNFPNTRQGVHYLRRALGSDAHRLSSPVKGSVMLDVTGLAVDVLDFDLLAQSSDLESWQRAVTLYRAPLLAEWLDPWLQGPRARRKRSFERLLKALLEQSQRQNRPADLEAYLRHAISAAPDDERWWRELLQALSRQGAYERLEQAYEALVAERMHRERPGEIETEALIARLRSDAESKVPVIPHSSVPPAESVPVGMAAVAVRDVPRPQVALLYKRSATPDETVMRLLEHELTAAGYSVFTDRMLRSGVAWAREIEQQVRQSHAVIPLLSAAAAQSEMLEYEVEIAHRAAQIQNGLPMLLPVRVAFTDPLPAPGRLADILDPLQYTLWQGPHDSERLVSSLLSALRTPSQSTAVALEPVRGAMPIDSSYYISRPSDQLLQGAIRRRDSIVLVKGARQMGKTSLLARGLQQARQLQYRVVRTDLQKLTQAQLASSDAFFFAVARSIAHQLGVPPPTRDDWDPDLGANMNMEFFLIYRALPSVEALVWALDEVDRLFTCPFAAEVFGLFRSWHNERSLEPDGPLSRLTLAIAYATEAHLFVTDLNQSPFNVGTRLALEDFTPEQVAELNRRYNGPLPDNESVRRLHRLVNGQPYLTRRGLDHLVTNRSDLSDLEAQGDRDEGPFGDHLRRILAALISDSGLTEIVRALVRGQACPSPESFYRLRSAGILTGEWGEPTQFRCRLYESYLKRHLV